MSIRVALHHTTTYRYDRLVSLAPQIVRLRPAPHCRTPIQSYSLKVRPGKHFINWQQDPHGNVLARLVFPDQTRELVVDVDLIAEMTVINPFDFFVESYAEQYPFAYEDWLARDLRPFLETQAAGPLLTRYVESIDRTPRNAVDLVVDVNRLLQHEIRYLIRMEPGVQTPEQTLTARSGSCRDSAWLMVQVLRHLGLAARFVSGYLIQLAPDVKSLDGPSGPEADFTDLHAWAEVYIPGAGWIGLDPTSGLLAGEGHIPLACTPDPGAASPITGSVDECKVAFQVAMQVTRIHEDPRVTRPCTDDQWREIDALGRQVDERLTAMDVRLTMGGEPTFISIDDMEGAEWNVAAVGPHKRRLSAALLKRLRDRFAPGGLLHYGQGKWYPGESLPRWALTCYWRKDGKPVWLNPDLIADEDRDYGFGPEHARKFSMRLAEVLGVNPKWIVPAYEDVYHYLWKEQRLPVNVDPRDPKLKDPEERERMARLFQQGLDRPTGFVMPLQRQWWQARPRWVSGPWPVRPERMFLLPGDSPVGLRLPLDSLPWLPAAQMPVLMPTDPLAPRPPLPDHPFEQLFLAGHPDATSLQGISEQECSPLAPRVDEARRHDSNDANPAHVVRTAMCVEPRRGRLYVFMPPVERLEDYLDLAAAIERTAAELRMPVIIEGYLPPHDDRIEQIKVTPDPGVIEVNIHPAGSWPHLVEHTTALYEEAHLCRLGTEKFDLDGRHTGTGGGNHVVLGGPTPADSPFLRRPDVLRSLLGYWNNHPSLSYLFSGRFIGPTSQAPRVDEGRRDSIYEMEIAFSQVPRGNGGRTSKSAVCDGGPVGDGTGGLGSPPYVPPWLVDRIFRHLLTDLTGNTHRAEFCIDKLYSPDSSSGRLGLVEFRGFEMPPHARMSLTQQLLIRALLAKFWAQPWDERLVEWGTTLHDRFLLPYFVWRDFGEVIDDLNRGLASGVSELAADVVRTIPDPSSLISHPSFRREWFAPHYEFRFPLIGELTQQDITLELRTAIEPWYVLGEEPGAAGTVRYVDSSVERLQVKVTGLTGARHAVTCNGRRVPLHPTGVQGEAVAGVRYRAWQPPSCLHPNIPVHTPLVFDILDTWQGRSIGGCTCHVSHPAGRNYATFPVNAYEAESRRAARFFRMGHTPGPMVVPPVEENAQFPLTLDLRQEHR